MPPKPWKSTNFFSSFISLQLTYVTIDSLEGSVRVHVDPRFNI